MSYQNYVTTAALPGAWRTARAVLRADVALPAAGYALVIVVLLGRQLGLLASHLPREPNASDAQLIAWILSWVAHAALDPVATVFDANINHPAPAQLTGSDYFLSSQLLFAPLWWLTREPILAVSLTALATYWLAGLCMDRLLRALGCPGGIAFACGVSFVFGPLHLPFNVHVLQYPAFFLPLLALCLTRLRERPDALRAAAVAAAFACAVLASIYAATFAGVVALLWALLELPRALPRRGRFVVLGGAAAIGGALPLLLIAPTYLERAAIQGLHETIRQTSVIAAVLADPSLLWIAVHSISVALILNLLTLPALVGWLRGDPLARRVVPVALVCIVAGNVLAAGVPDGLRGTLVEHAFRFVRHAHRFAIVGAFGGTLLLAASLASITTWLPARLAPAPAAVALVLVLVKALPFGSGEMREVAAFGRDRMVHRMVAQILASNGPGPLLELPRHGEGRAADAEAELYEPDSMLASTRHWAPLIAGYTGHQPPHRLLLVNLVHALPDREALADLIDVTRLRWILLRPARDWRPDRPRGDVERALRASRAIGRAWELGDWLLLEVVGEPRHPSWYAAVAAGWRDGFTVLGTALQPLPDGADVGVIQATPLPERLPAREPVHVKVRLQNAGTTTWPASVPPSRGLGLNFALGAEVPRTRTVMLVERWVPSGAGDARQREIRLRRDVPAGEDLRQNVLAIAPDEPGRYRYELSLVQIDGARFAGPGNVGVAQDVVVTVAKPRTAPSPRPSAGATPADEPPPDA